MGGEEKETVFAVEVDPLDRTKEIAEPFEAEVRDY